MEIDLFFRKLTSQCIFLTSSSPLAAILDVRHSSCGPSCVTTVQFFLLQFLVQSKAFSLSWASYRGGKHSIRREGDGRSFPHQEETGNERIKETYVADGVKMWCPCLWEWYMSAAQLCFSVVHQPTAVCLTWLKSLLLNSPLHGWLQMDLLPCIHLVFGGVSLQHGLFLDDHRMCPSRRSTFGSITSAAHRVLAPETLQHLQPLPYAFLYRWNLNEADTRMMAEPDSSLLAGLAQRDLYLDWESWLFPRGDCASHAMVENIKRYFWQPSGGDQRCY